MIQWRCARTEVRGSHASGTGLDVEPRSANRLTRVGRYSYVTREQEFDLTEQSGAMTVKRPRVGLVLGGGGLKGFAHIGVLEVLHEAGFVPDVIAGSSIGSLIASAYALGTPVHVMRERALALKRKDLFRVNAGGFARGLLRSPSFYAAEPLQGLIAGVIPDVRFDTVRETILVNTVDLERGMQVVWGLEGFRDASIRDAVYASCALPGFFPPGDVAGRVCVDGGTIDNMPVTAVAGDLDLIVAVDVGNSEVQQATDITEQGVGSIFMRAATLMMRTLQEWPLSHWNGPPIVLIRPKVSQFGWFNFEKIPLLIEAGKIAAAGAMDVVPQALRIGHGIFPRRPVTLDVVQEKCTGCGLCIEMAPHAMTRSADGKAEPVRREVEWSPPEGDFVQRCPTGAIVMVRHY
jgi:NTE family protein